MSQFPVIIFRPIYKIVWPNFWKPLLQRQQTVETVFNLEPTFTAPIARCSNISSHCQHKLQSRCGPKHTWLEGCRSAGNNEIKHNNTHWINLIDFFCLTVFVWSPWPPSFNFWVCPIWAAASQKINVPCGGRLKRSNQKWPLKSLKLHSYLLCTSAPNKQNGYFYSIRKNQKKGRRNMNYDTGSDRQLEYDPKESMDMDWRPDNSIHTNFVPGENAVRIPKIQQ